MGSLAAIDSFINRGVNNLSNNLIQSICQDQDSYLYEIGFRLNTYNHL